jgi:hypothetical protein
MKIAFGTPITAIDGEVLKRSNVDSAPATVGFIAVSALLAESDESLDAKVRAFSLAQRIVDKNEVDITPEESTTIKNRVGAVYKNVTVCARVVETLNG